MDKIRLKNMRFHAFHGCKPLEKEIGQEIQVDVELALSLAEAGVSDELADACCFDDVYKLIADRVLNTRYNLLEALGEDICNSIHEIYPDTGIKLVLRKPHPPFEGELDSVEIEITRP